MKGKIYTGGTLGDAFIILLKLLYYDYKDIIHTTAHVHLFETIEKVYSLKKNLNVEFEKYDVKKHTNIKKIRGHIDGQHKIIAFPKFDLPNIKKFDLPKKYIVIQLQSGSNKSNLKFLNKLDLKFLNKEKRPVVLIGGCASSLLRKFNNIVIDLRRKTNILEAFSVLEKADEFYGPQGLLAFFALSQKKKTNIFIKSHRDKRACAVRVDKIKEWTKYVNYR